MDLPDLRGRKRIEIAAAEMVIMRAKNDILAGFAGKIGEDVVHFGVDGLDVDGKRGAQRVRKVERRRFVRGIDLLLHILQSLSCRLKPAVRDIVLHLGEQNADVFRAADAAEPRE